MPNDQQPPRRESPAAKPTHTPPGAKPDSARTQPEPEIGDDVDESSLESFPASDPPSSTSSAASRDGKS